jgi:hypothetical protein
MKKAILLAAGLFLLLAIGCKKETTNIIPPATLAGEWYGFYGSGSQVPNTDWYFKIRPDMTMKIAHDDTTTYVADSIYYVPSADSIRCTFTYKQPNGTPGGTFSFIGRYSHSYTIMSGTWGAGSSPYNCGSFIMGRKQ